MIITDNHTVISTAVCHKERYLMSYAQFCVLSPVCRGRYRERCPEESDQ